MNVSKTSLKTARYLAAAGTFIAGGQVANAAIVQGTIGDRFYPDPNIEATYIDLDNDDNPEFALMRQQMTNSISSYTYTYSFLVIRGIGSTVAIGLDSGSGPWAQNFANGSMVGPLSRATYSSYSSNNLAALSINTNASYPIPPAGNNSFKNNPGFGIIGVSFMIGSNTHYGFIQVFTDPANHSYKIFNAYYEDIPDTPIKGTSSNPVPLLLLASGLGFGAIGLMAFLKKRKQLA